MAESCVKNIYVLYNLILRYLNRRCMSTEEDDDVASNELVPVHRISSRRVVPEAHQSLIDSLPLFSFNTISSGLKSSSADCAVCLSKFETDDQLRLLPLCCHAFHSTCIDTWLGSNHTCPLCRSTVHVDGSEGYLKLLSSSPSSRSESFRVEIGNVSSRRIASDSGNGNGNGNDRRRSYSIGSFEYLVEEETAEILVEPTHRRVASEIVLSRKKNEDEATLPPLETKMNPNPNPPGSEIASEVGTGGRGSWLKDYVDRLSVSSASISSRTLSFRLSGRFFTGSSRRSEGFTGSSRRSNENGGSWDLERNEYGEQIGNFLRWLSGV
ncbi:RING-type E3 ubiquitin transferase [Ranunculus cassubicifolius]